MYDRGPGLTGHSKCRGLCPYRSLIAPIFNCETKNSQTSLLPNPPFHCAGINYSFPIHDPTPAPNSYIISKSKGWGWWASGHWACRSVEPNPWLLNLPCLRHFFHAPWPASSQTAFSIPLALAVFKKSGYQIQYNFEDQVRDPVAFDTDGFLSRKQGVKKFG